MNKEKEGICYGGLKGYGKTYCEMIRLQQENKELHNKIDKAIELNIEIDESLRMKNTNAYIELEDMLFKQWKILKDSDVDE